MPTPTASVAGLVLYSPAPQALAAFYERAFSFTLDAAKHGNMGQHFEGLLNGVHIAIWDTQRPPAEAGGLECFGLKVRIRVA